jgi:hypothetical protein
LTQVPGAASGGTTKRYGYFDANDGIFLEQTGTDLAIVRRSSTSGSVVDVRVPQASWNLDAFNGSGASGITLDMTKAQILVIDLQWLGMGRVRVGFDINGAIMYAHQFLNANNLTVPYMKTANLPIRWEITNATTASAATSLLATCSAVISEGGFEEERGYSFAYTTPAAVSADTNGEYLVGIRPKETFNSITNRGQIILDNVQVMNTGTASAYCRVHYNPTVTGGSWTSVSANSIVEYGLGQTLSAPGEIIASFFVPTGAATDNAFASDLISRLPITLNTSGASPATVALEVISVTGSQACWGTLSWKELR